MDFDSFFIISNLLVILTLAVYIFFYHSKDERTWEDAFNQNKKTDLGEEIKKYDPSKKAVIIRGNKRKFLIKNAWIILYFTPIILFGLYEQFIEDSFCSFTFGIHNSLIVMFIPFEALPFGMFLLTLSWLRSSIETIKTGYFPPLNETIFFDTIAVNSLYSKLRGYLNLLAPLVFLILWYQMHTFFMEQTEDNPIEWTEKKYKKQQF